MFVLALSTQAFIYITLILQIWLKQNQESRQGHRSFPSDLSVSEKGNYIRSIDGNYYMFSAIFVNLSDPAKRFYHHNKVIAVQGWEHISSSRNTFLCCIVLHNETEFCVNVVKKTFSDFNVPLNSASCVCPVNFNQSEIRSLTIISQLALEKILKQWGSVFKAYPNHYIAITPVMYGKDGGLAICSQITYGDTDASMLVEWFETQKLLGIDKIMTHTYQLNSEAMQVLEHYESEGYLLLVKDFEFPEKGKTSPVLLLKNHF